MTNEQVGEYAISEVARLSGVTSRTLRHYDAVGLLAPSRVGSNGLRYYGHAELMRLQRILVLRELGFGLESIAAVLDDDSVDELAAFRHHRAAVLAERERSDGLLVAIDRTIAELEGGPAVSDDDVFSGLPGYDPVVQADREREAGERWGADVVVESRQRTASWSKTDAAEVMAEHELIVEELARSFTTGAASTDAEVQALVARHHAWVSHFWTPNAQAYVGLGELYVEDPRFRANYDAHAEGLAAFLRDAIVGYAQTLLSDVSN